MRGERREGTGERGEEREERGKGRGEQGEGRAGEGRGEESRVESEVKLVSVALQWVLGRLSGDARRLRAGSFRAVQGVG